jgi:uncharacterized protein YceK
MKSIKNLGIAIVVLMLGGCGGLMSRLAANGTVDIMENAARAFDKESEIWLARNAANANLKMMEGLLETVPENQKLLTMTAKTFALYAFAFMEDDLEALDYGTDEFEVVKMRAVNFNLRSRAYAIRSMEVDIEDFGAAALGSGERLWQILAECDESHVAGVYWLALSWGALINLQTDDPEWLADLGRVKRIMNWVRARDPGYQHGGPNLFYGMINTAIPKQLGGKPEEAKLGFEAAIAITGGRYLMAKALYARKYMPGVNNRAGYKRLLTEVIDAPADIMKSQRLANQIAKKRAKRWIAEIDDIFDEEE